MSKKNVAEEDSKRERREVVEERGDDAPFRLTRCGRRHLRQSDARTNRLAKFRSQLRGRRRDLKGRKKKKKKKKKKKRKKKKRTKSKSKARGLPSPLWRSRTRRAERRLSSAAVRSKLPAG